jgi:hypothetical protein
MIEVLRVCRISHLQPLLPPMGGQLHSSIVGYVVDILQVSLLFGLACCSMYAMISST